MTASFEGALPRATARFRSQRVCPIRRIAEPSVKCAKSRSSQANSYQGGGVELPGRDDGVRRAKDVPEIAWHFFIGGYQPAQKWLKDRKGRALNHHDIIHSQKIIVALVETE